MNEYLYDILDQEGIVQDHRTIRAGSPAEADIRVKELRTEGDTWRLVEVISSKKDESCNLIDFTGFTGQGDEIAEWHDDETGQYAVTLDREPRGFNGVDVYFDTQASAHAFFLALCDAKSVYVAGE